MAALTSPPPPVRRRQWTTPQHGAWAMLLLPFVAGLRHGTAWAQVPLLVAWVGGYLASYFATLGLKSRRWSRYSLQLRVYGVVAGLAALVAVVAAPRVLVAAPVLLVGGLVLAVAARLRRDRGLVAGLAAVVQASAMALVVPVAAGRVLGTGWQEALACLLYLTGSLLFVKTMIRERESVAYRWASWVWHVAALGVAAAVNPWVAVPFGLFLARAVVLPGRKVPVVAVGMVELACTLVLLGFLLLA